MHCHFDTFPNQSSSKESLIAVWNEKKCFLDAQSWSTFYWFCSLCSAERILWLDKDYLSHTHKHTHTHTHTVTPTIYFYLHPSLPALSKLAISAWNAFVIWHSFQMMASHTKTLFQPYSTDVKIFWFRNRAHLALFYLKLIMLYESRTYRRSGAPWFNRHIVLETVRDTALVLAVFSCWKWLTFIFRMSQQEVLASWRRSQKCANPRPVRQTSRARESLSHGSQGAWNNTRINPICWKN